MQGILLLLEILLFFWLRTVLLPVPSVVAAVFQPTEVCEYQILSTYDVTTGR